VTEHKLISYKGLGLCNELAGWHFLLLVLLSSAASQLVSVSWFRGCGEKENSCPGFFQHYTMGQSPNRTLCTVSFSDHDSKGSVIDLQ